MPRTPVSIPPCGLILPPIHESTFETCTCSSNCRLWTATRLVRLATDDSRMSTPVVCDATMLVLPNQVYDCPSNPPSRVPRAPLSVTSVRAPEVPCTRTPGGLSVLYVRSRIARDAAMSKMCDRHLTGITETLSCSEHFDLVSHQVRATPRGAFFSAQGPRPSVGLPNTEFPNAPGEPDTPHGHLRTDVLLTCCDAMHACVHW